MPCTKFILTLTTALILCLLSTALAVFNGTDDDFSTFNRELYDDPIGMGYDVSAVVEGCRDLINDPESNVGEETHPLELTPQVVLKAMSFHDYRKTSTEGRAYIDLVVGIGGDLDPYREKLLEALPQKRETEFPLRRLSRAEILFGVGTRLFSIADCNTAVGFCGNVRCPDE